MKHLRHSFTRTVFVPALLACTITLRAAPPTSTDAEGNTPLHLAALRGDDAAVDALLSAGADPNSLNRAGAAPLHYAVMSEHMVSSLLAHGARANVVSKIKVSPLMSASARSDSFAIVRRLIEAGADVNVQRELPPEGLGANALSLAVLAGDQRTVGLLLDPNSGVDPQHYSQVLVTAALVGDEKTTAILLDRGTDPNGGAGLAGNALNSALALNHVEIAKMLVERGASLKTKSLRGPGTPPMVFSAYSDGCDPAAVQLLLEHGADINVTDDAGQTALSYALKKGADSETVRWLRAHGAKEPVASLRPKSIPDRDVPNGGDARAARIREGAQLAIDLLQISSTAFLQNGFVKKSNCTSCHQQSLPAVAFGWARERGLRIDEHELGRQLVAKVNQRAVQLERARQLMQPTGGAAIPLGYDAEEMAALHSGPTEITEATSYYLLGTQQSDGSWPSLVMRMPTADTFITSTAWAARALQLYPPVARVAEAQAALSRARTWLASQQPVTTNRRVFQLLGLAWSNATPEGMRPLADDLAHEQRTDGGWSQLEALESDAWATGSALIALHKAGIASTDPVYQKGVTFLLRTQFDDGSWWVRSRSWPFQPHFNAKFPHGKDQWISASGTAWATMALLLTLEPTVDPTTLPTSEKLIAAYRESAAAERPNKIADSSLADTPAVATMNFTRDIAPIFDRSCVKCHSGKKPKGSFDLTRRDSLLKGGQSGEPAIVPGYADDSPLLQQILGQVEDLEMPPLARREKFPPLNPEEIDRLRAWIDAGAPWPTEDKSLHASLETGPSEID
ncbi:MAG: ankyrin repeat domain-containing protein [Opitutus sp.]